MSAHSWEILDMQRARIGWICGSVLTLALFQAGRAFDEERVVVDLEDSAHGALFAETGGHSDHMETAFREANPSLFTYRDGARLHASWEFPDPETVDRKVWYRMLVDWPRNGAPSLVWLARNR